MVAYTKPQQRKKEESERLRCEGYQIKFTDFRFEIWQAVIFRESKRALPLLGAGPFLIAEI